MNFFVVKHVEADYKKPATFADELEVTSKVIKRKKTLHWQFFMKFLEEMNYFLLQILF